MAAKNYWEENQISGTELMAMRMMRGKTHQEMVKLARKYKGPLYVTISAKEFDWYEKNVQECPQDITEFYMRELGITRSHMTQFKKILKGQLKTFTEDREIPQSIKTKVRRKYKNRCAKCRSTRHLHYHHIEYFSKGGQNTVDNLILLCASCHAEEHKGEKAYHMLKKQSEG